MAPIRQFFLPPLNWPDFETLTVSTAEHVFANRFVETVGRSGQDQGGLDVYIPDLEIGIQCKRHLKLGANGAPRPGGGLSARDLRKAVEDADKGRRRLTKFILATTAPASTKLQEFAHDLSRERAEQSLCGVTIWFWDQFVLHLNNYDSLARHYYEHVLQIRTPDDQDRKIIDVLTRAFDRPAFQDPINNEHGDNFEQALADTVHTLNTGELIDRRRRQTFEAAYGGRDAVLNDEWREQLDYLYEEVALLRQTYAVSIKQQKIVVISGYLQTHDPLTEQFMNEHRQALRAAARQLRQNAGLP